MKKEYCVISHTHWDREWYFTFETFRYRLVKLIDNLLEIMRREPEYIFHLDAQTIVLEDYLKIKPQNESLLKKYIREGRIIVGPWYVQNDFYLTDGEATIRNLMIGTEIADEFGACGKTGYIPDQFGNISQLPQIYNQFGIKTCLMGRGYSFYDVNENGELVRRMTSPEFYWKGKDGSEVLTVRFTTWYNNAQRFSEDVEKNLKHIKRIEDAYQGTARLPYYLLMNGVDHLEAQENLLEVLPPLNERLSDGAVKQCTMQEFTDKVEAYIKENNINIEDVTGELRYGHDSDLLKGTLSARVYLKTANAKAQNRLENVIEPLYAMAEAYGFKNIYPKDYLKYLWKLLIENHPHDSICGCSVDGVHDMNMADRTARFNDAAAELENDVLGALTAHVSREGMTDADYIVSVWNTFEEQVSGTAEAEFNFPVNEGFENFVILDESGNEVLYDVIRKDDYCMKTTSPINLPGQIDCDSYLVKFAVDEIPPMSYRAYTVKRAEGTAPAPAEAETAQNIILENELFIVSVNGMGEVDIKDKYNGKTYENCIRLEDMGELGHSYVHYDIEGDIPITTDGIKPEITLIKNTAIEKSCIIKYVLDLPACLDINTLERSKEAARNTVELRLSLTKGEPWVGIECRVDNKSRDHRLRILFDTGMKTDYTTSLIPFDTIARDRREVLRGIANGTQPNSGLIHIGEDGYGMGIMNEGLYEYEHLLGERGTVAVTLIRSVSAISTLENRHQRNTMKNEGSQCIGTYTMRLGIGFADGGEAEQVSRLVRLTKRFQNGLIAYFQPYSERKFTGGRPQVQDSDMAELFFREDKYKDVTLGKQGGLFEIDGDAMTVSAVKQSEDGRLLVIRAYNTTDNETDFKVKLSRPVHKAYRLTMGEEINGELNTGASIKVKPREVVTVGFELK